MLDEKTLNELKSEIAEYSDKAVLDIIKKRSHYNQSVARFAIEEAIKRNLINSEEDLLAEEFRVEPLRFGFFPKIANQKIKWKITKSLSRGVLLVGLIPLIYGFLKFAENKLFESAILLVLGFVWIISSAMLMRTKEIKFIYAIMAMAVLSAFYIVNTLLSLKGVKFMDFFVIAIIYGIVFYSLLYIKFLNSDRNTDELSSS